MIIGIVKELKVLENRVGLTPPFVSHLVQSGHEVLIESSCGNTAGFFDEQYLESGGKVVSSANDVYSASDVILKVQEIQPSEYNLIKNGQLILSYCHLAPNRNLLEALLNSGSTCIAYETVTDEYNRLPLLEPISLIAGRMSMIIASNLLSTINDGSGILISGVPGVEPANVTIIGGGTVGSNAAMVACGMCADVTLIDSNTSALKKIDSLCHGRVKTIFSTRDNIMTSLKRSDIVISSALEYASESPKIITRDMIKAMKDGSVVVDVSIDQGGCSETSHPTMFSDPTYQIDGVIHYCVPNMTSAFARTASVSLSNAVYPYIKKIADLGLKEACLEINGLKNGLNVINGQVTHQCVAKAHNLPYVDPCQILI